MTPIYLYDRTFSLLLIQCDVLHLAGIQNAERGTGDVAQHLEQAPFLVELREASILLGEAAAHSVLFSRTPTALLLPQYNPQAATRPRQCASVEYAQREQRCRGDAPK